jgi:hypothetical protein
MQDIESVDLLVVGNLDAPDGVLFNSLSKKLPFRGVELLGVVNPVDIEFFGKDNGGGDNRAGKWAAASLVGAGATRPMFKPTRHWSIIP